MQMLPGQLQRSNGALQERVAEVQLIPAGDESAGDELQFRFAGITFLLMSYHPERDHEISAET